ncbi:Protein of unknown function [Gryllus bimaculatus]|nr:Protein of unknown function [Gryllus bimaculatus]
MGDANEEESAPKAVEYQVPAIIQQHELQINHVRQQLQQLQHVQGDEENCQEHQLQLGQPSQHYGAQCIATGGAATSAPVFQSSRCSTHRPQSQESSPMSLPGELEERHFGSLEEGDDDAVEEEQEKKQKERKTMHLLELDLNVWVDEIPYLKLEKSASDLGRLPTSNVVRKESA